MYNISNSLNNKFSFLVKIDMAKQLVILEEEYEASTNSSFFLSFFIFGQLILFLKLFRSNTVFQDISLDDLRDELPERQPRYPDKIQQNPNNTVIAKPFKDTAELP